MFNEQFECKAVRNKCVWNYIDNLFSYVSKCRLSTATSIEGSEKVRFFNLFCM